MGICFRPGKFNLATWRNASELVLLISVTLIGIMCLFGHYKYSSEIHAYWISFDTIVKILLPAYVAFNTLRAVSLSTEARKLFLQRNILLSSRDTDTKEFTYAVRWGACCSLLAAALTLSLFAQKLYINIIGALFAPVTSLGMIWGAMLFERHYEELLMRGEYNKEGNHNIQLIPNNNQVLYPQQNVNIRPSQIPMQQLQIQQHVQ